MLHSFTHMTHRACRHCWRRTTYVADIIVYYRMNWMNLSDGQKKWNKVLACLFCQLNALITQDNNVSLHNKNNL